MPHELVRIRPSSAACACEFVLQTLKDQDGVCEDFIWRVALVDEVRDKLEERRLSETRRCSGLVRAAVLLAEIVIDNQDYFPIPVEVVAVLTFRRLVNGRPLVVNETRLGRWWGRFRILRGGRSRLRAWFGLGLFSDNFREAV